MSGLKYYINRPNTNRNLVELWSTIRLPFEPKGWIKDMRNSLRESIKMIRSSGNSMLHAVYISDHNEYDCDVENVLLYNVGSGAFSDHCSTGLCLERQFASIPQIPGCSDNMSHYSCYKVVSIEQGPEYWERGKTLVSWTNICCPPIRSNSKPHYFWYALKNGQVDIFHNIEKPKNFGIELNINVLKGTKIKLAAAVKPLMDGIISAFHEHDGSNISFLSNFLAEFMMLDKSVIEHKLMDSTMAILGKRRLLHPFGQGVQWNPADDRCMVIKILVNDSLQKDEWKISGELFTITTKDKSSS